MNTECSDTDETRWAENSLRAASSLGNDQFGVLYYSLLCAPLFRFNRDSPVAGRTHSTPRFSTIFIYVDITRRKPDVLHSFGGRRTRFLFFSRSRTDVTRVRTSELFRAGNIHGGTVGKKIL